MSASSAEFRSSIAPDVGVKFASVSLVVISVLQLASLYALKVYAVSVVRLERLAVVPVCSAEQVAYVPVAGVVCLKRQLPSLPVPLPTAQPVSVSVAELCVTLDAASVGVVVVKAVAVAILFAESQASSLYASNVYEALLVKPVRLAAAVPALTSLEHVAPLPVCL